MSIASRARRARFLVLLVAAVAWPSLGAAAPSCTSAFTELKAPDGATFYRTASSYPGLDVRQALEQYRKIATDDGYLLVTQPDATAAIPSMGIAKPPSPHPTAIMVDRASSSISLTTIVAPGQRVDAAAERTRLCGLVAQFEAGRAGTRAPRETAEQAQQRSRTTIPEAIPSVRVVSPGAVFDAAAAKAALAPGRSVIRGQACASYNGAIAFASGSQVFLYPATPYLEEFIRLSKKAKPGRDQLVPEPEALSTRMEATANAKGEFQFSQMKPGRYFLLTSISALLGGTHDVYAGRVENNYASANVYRAEEYTFDDASQLSQFVDVRRDGDVVKVTLQPPITPNPFHHGLRGSILGCHALP